MGSVFYGGTDGVLLFFVGHMRIIIKLADAMKKTQTRMAVSPFFKALFVLAQASFWGVVL